MQQVELSDEPVDRPDDFDLDATWGRIVTHVEQQRAAVRVRAAVDPAMITPVRYMFANRCDILGETDDGRIEVLLRENSPEALAAQVAGFGAQIDLRPASFPAGAFAQTSIVNATVILHAREETLFDAYVARSFAELHTGKWSNDRVIGNNKKCRHGTQN